ncbi:MAG: hypothetical protein NTY41_08650 [Proteobacteria bacterium]|nr:hypothetical protein [Pseudomonadota bacterium]
MKNRVQSRTAERLTAAVSSIRQRPGMLRSMLDAQLRERKQITARAIRVKGLMPLLMKPRNGQRWTRSERDELHEQLRALMHLSPYLVVLALPGSFLMLPVLAWWLDSRRSRRPDGEPA